MASKRLNIAILGGGIGGLFAANALISQGLEVAVYEQAPELGEIGAGFFLTPNSARQRIRLGLGPSIERWGSLVGEGSQYLHRDGSHIAEVQVEDANGWNATYGMHRADMIELLVEQLPESVIHCGYRGIDFFQDEKSATVKFENGEKVEASLIVAADGIHSELRPYVYPPSTPVFHGTISYRGLVLREKLPEWPMDRWLMWAGASKPFLVFPVRHGKMINYVGFVPADKKMRESWSAEGDPDQLRAEFEGWDPKIQEVLEQVDQTFRWALYDRETLPTWPKGRLTLLGDAAHPMLPHLGQGANQTMEDGMALAIILSNIENSAVPAALIAYDNLRRERVAEIVLGARQNGLPVDSMSQYADPDKRDTELAAHADFRKQLYAYDVVPDAVATAAALI